MAIILVPAPPKSAFNKNRPVSDLLQYQLRHFQHVEAALPNELHSNMTQRDLSTESGAARYIAHLTKVLKSRQQLPAPVPIRPRPARPARTRDSFEIAAAATDTAPPPDRSRSRKSSATHSDETRAEPTTAASEAVPKRKPRRKP